MVKPMDAGVRMRGSPSQLHHVLYEFGQDIDPFLQVTSPSRSDPSTYGQVYYNDQVSQYL